VDHRTDIFAFGCVVYEMLTGRRVFEGEDVADTLANVLKAQPAWTSLPPETPPAIRRLLRRCLEKDRRQRLSDIADARLEIDEAQSPVETAEIPMASASAPLPAPRSSRMLPWVMATVFLVAFIASLAGRYLESPGPALKPIRFEINAADIGLST